MPKSPLRRLRARKALLARWLGAQKSFLAVATVLFLNGFMWPSIASRIPAIASHHHLSATTLGLALLGQALGLAVGMLGGPLYDRFKARTVAVGSGLAYAVTTALVGWAPGAITLFAVLIAWGIANGVLDAAQGVLGNKLPKPDRGSIWTRLELGFATGQLAGSGLGAWFATWATPRLHLTIVAAIGVGLVLLAARVLPGDVRLREEGPAVWMPHIPRHRIAPRPRIGRRSRHRAHTFRWKRLGYRRPLARLAVLASIGLWLESVVPDWSGLFLEHQVHAPVSTWSFGNLTFFVSLTAVQIVVSSPLLASRLHMAAVSVAGAVFAAGMLLATLGGSKLLPALAGFALCGAGAAAIQPLAFEAAARHISGSFDVGKRVQIPAYLASALEKSVTGLLAGRFGYGRALQTTIVLGVAALAIGLTLLGAPAEPEQPTTGDAPGPPAPA